MSWDILIFNSNKPVDFENSDLPEFDSREIVINKIKTTFPDSNWNDPSWGLLGNQQCSIEFNIGDDEAMGNHFMLHVRGGENPTTEIVKMCKQHDWIAFDISGERFLDEKYPEANSFDEWKSYRDQIVAPQKPWWKFW
jgi:hypothetical protein